MTYKKVDKYSNLSDYYHFVPVGIETYGAYGPQGIKLVKQICKKIQDATGEKLSTFYLFNQWQYNEAVQSVLQLA